MKEFQLSTPRERITGISVSAVAVVCFGILLFALRNNVTMLIICALAVLLLTVLLVFYVLSILKSKCILDPEKKTLEVIGYPSYTKDISNAVLLQTVGRKSGHAMTRVLVFSDAEEKIIAVVPTLYTYRQGLLAEPMAKEMAAFLGIGFKENIPAWEYDKEKAKEHEKEEAEREKQERAERKKQRYQRLLYRYRKKK